MKHLANLAAGAAFVFGLTGFYLYTSRLETRLSGGRQKGVLIVTQDLEAGQSVAADHLGEVQIPESYLDGRRILATDKKKVLGVALSIDLEAGDALVWSDLRDGEAHLSLASLITPGHRAVRLPSKANPLGRLLQVGDHVDVLVERAGKSEVLFERVLVVALGNTLDTADEAEAAPGGRMDAGVTLSVTQEQATELFGARARGDLQLVLRNPKDDQLRRSEVVEKPVLRPQLAPPKRKEIEHVR